MLKHAVAFCSVIVVILGTGYLYNYAKIKYDLYQAQQEWFASHNHKDH